uniref:BPTI/Kunitz inhibitor domain-containing protein n=1 Tax=Caenorhabditis japonica TaxID=281687 RepID=A0A8R1I1U8_CAEJA
MWVYLILFVSFTSAVDVFSDCTLPLELGKTPCKAGKKEIKYHFDPTTMTCMAFEYTGCGGNKNLFNSDSECWRTCLPIDHFGCPAASPPLKSPEVCQEDKECGAKGICKWGQGFGICCDKAISEKVDADYHPKCAKGTNVVKYEEGGIPSTRIGKTCKSNHCPKGATCMQGTYFATCCK